MEHLKHLRKMYRSKERRHKIAEWMIENKHLLDDMLFSELFRLAKMMVGKSAKKIDQNETKVSGR